MWVNHAHGIPAIGGGVCALLRALRALCLRGAPHFRQRVQHAAALTIVFQRIHKLLCRQWYVSARVRTHTEALRPVAVATWVVTFIIDELDCSTLGASVKIVPHHTLRLRSTLCSHGFIHSPYPV